MEPTQYETLSSKVFAAIDSKLESTSTMDAEHRFDVVAAASTTIIVDFFMSQPTAPPSILTNIAEFRSQLASRSVQLLETLQAAYLSGAKGPAPADRFLNRTRPIYDFVRVTLGIKMHGEVNRKLFVEEPGMEEQSIGQNVSLIHEVCHSTSPLGGSVAHVHLVSQAIRDGKMQGIVVSMFDQTE